MEILSRAVDGLKMCYNVSLSPEEVEKVTLERLQKIAKDIKIDGFRPGKAPVEILKRRYGEAAKSEALDNLVSSTATGILKDEDISRYIGFRCNVIKNDETGVEFTMNFEIIPSVELRDFSAIEIKKYNAEITDKEIDDVLKSIMQYKKKCLDEADDAVVELNQKVSITLHMKTKLKKQMDSK
jgi:trigger factor